MIISLDIETQGLKINDAINFVGLYTVNSANKELFNCYKFPEEAEECRSFITKLQNKGAKFVMHKGKFDSGRLKYQYDIDVHIDHDTLYLEYLMCTVDELKYYGEKKADNTKRKKYLSLKATAQRRLGVEDWDIDNKDKTSTDKNKVAPYLFKDVKYTYELYQWFKKHFPESKMKTYKLMIRAANVYRDIEINGLPINYEKLDETYKYFDEELNKNIEQLKVYGDINYNSSKQLQELLFIKLQLPIKKYTDKGSPATGVEALTELLGEHPIIDLLLKYRENKKAREFCESWKTEAILHKDGHYYLHSDFNLHGTVTGRTSSSDVNLQQIPRNKKLKSLFQSVDPEWELVCEDFSQLELRMAGIVANVKAIKDSYRKGEDLHYKMASIVTGKPIEQITKTERTQAKAANFGKYLIN